MTGYLGHPDCLTKDDIAHLHYKGIASKTVAGRRYHDELCVKCKEIEKKINIWNNQPFRRYQ